MERRRGISLLVQRYNSRCFAGLKDSMCSNKFDDSGINNCGAEYSDKCWRWHTSLSRPKTWNDLRERNILNERAFDVAFRSVTSSKNRNFQSSGKLRKVSDKNEELESINFPTVEDIIRGKFNVELDPALLEDWMDQEMFDVYSFPLLDHKVRFFLWSFLLH